MAKSTIKDKEPATKKQLGRKRGKRAAAGKMAKSKDKAKFFGG